MKKILLFIMILISAASYSQTQTMRKAKVDTITVNKAGAVNFLSTMILKEGDSLYHLKISNDTIYLNDKFLITTGVVIYISGDTLFAGGDTLIMSGINYWTLTGNDLTNNNSGFVIIDSLLKIYPLPAEGGPRGIGRFLGIETDGHVQYWRPQDVIDTLKVTDTTLNNYWTFVNPDTLKNNVATGGVVAVSGVLSLTNTSTVDTSVIKFEDGSTFISAGFQRFDIYIEDTNSIFKALIPQTFGIGLGYNAYKTSGSLLSNAFGAWALEHDIGGNQINGFGANALQYNKGDESNGMGGSVMQYNTGARCHGFGTMALWSNTGDDVTGIGRYSLMYNNGDSNIAIGNMSFLPAIEDLSSQKIFDYTDIDPNGDTITITDHGFGAIGTYVTLRLIIGVGSIPGINSGTYQFYIEDADNLILITDDITAAGTGNSHTLTKWDPCNYSNSIAIGYGSTPTASNQIMLGNTNTEETYINGDVTITGQVKYDYKHLVIYTTGGSYTPNTVSNVEFRLLPTFSTTENDGLTFAGDSITVITPGDYFIQFGVSLQGANGSDWIFKCRKNGVAIITGNLALSTSGAGNYISGQWFWYLLSLAAGDDICFTVTNEGGTDDPTFRSIKVFMEMKPE